MKFQEPTRKPSVIYADNSWEFGKSGEELFWNLCTSTPHRSETTGLVERAVRKVKEGTSAELLQPGLDNEWCEIFKISCLMGKHHMKGGSECPLTDLWYLLEQWSNITLSLRKTYRDYINLGQKSCQVNSSVMYCTREESGKETSRSQTLKNWRTWTHQKSTPEGSMQRKCQRRWKVKSSFSQSQMEQFNISGGDQRLRPSTLIQDRPERGEGQEVLRGESDGLSSPTPHQDDSTLDDAEARNDFWSITGDFICRHHVEPTSQPVHAERRIISYSDEVHRSYQKQTHTRHFDAMMVRILTITGTWMEKENYQMHGQVSQDSLYWMNGHLMDFHGPVRRLTRKQTTSRPDKLWPEM